MQTMSEKLRARRKQRRLRFLRLLIILVILMAALVAGWRYIHRPDFAYGNVQITGTKLLDEAKILQISGNKAPFNMFNVDADLVEEALQHDVRFEAASAEYKWPGVLHVMVKERKPALYLANAYDSYAKVDYNGIVMDVTNGIPDDKAPMLTGEKCGSLYIGDKIGNGNILLVLDFLNNIDKVAEEQFTEIAIDEEKNVKLQLKAGFPILMGNIKALSKKADLFMIVFNEIKNRKITAEYIDLTFAKPYIKLKAKDNEGK